MMLILMDHTVINASFVDDDNSASDDVDDDSYDASDNNNDDNDDLDHDDIMVIMTMTPAWRLAGQNNPAAAQHFNHWLQHLSAALKDFHK